MGDWQWEVSSLEFFFPFLGEVQRLFWYRTYLGTYSPTYLGAYVCV